MLIYVNSSVNRNHSDCYSTYYVFFFFFLGRPSPKSRASTSNPNEMQLWFDSKYFSIFFFFFILLFVPLGSDLVALMLEREASAQSTLRTF